ncbi:MAG TPA: DUF3572 domain-containing protein [Xanthobacteraceae bacterium]|jgi:uncharacterized protein DUF3572|nr:DUF3572 domain-containing protein [Xanthobacteraceae bacterium]
MRSKTPITSAERRAAAEQLALAALAFLAADATRLGGFLAATGLGPENLREAARNPSFLPGVLDHVLSDEPMLIAFAAEESIDPKVVAQARQALAPSEH